MCFSFITNVTQRSLVLQHQLTTHWRCWKPGTDFLSFTNCLISFDREKQEKTWGRWVRILMKSDLIDGSCNTTLFSFITLTFHSAWTIVSLWSVYKWTHVCLHPNDVTKMSMSNIGSDEQSFIFAGFFLLLILCQVDCTRPPLSPTLLQFFYCQCVTRGWDLNSGVDLICWFKCRWYWIRCETIPDCATEAPLPQIYAAANGRRLCHSTRLILLANSVIPCDPLGISDPLNKTLHEG